MAADWKKVVGGLAPTIATALGGPLAGTAVRYLSEKLLGDPNRPEEDVAAAISGANPDQLAKLREIDNEFKVKMQQSRVDLEKINQADRASARELAEKTTIWPQIILGAIFVGAFAYTMYIMLTGAKIAPEMHDIVIYLLGILSACLAQIMNFFFGSSSGSKHKDTAMANAMNNKKG